MINHWEEGEREGGRGREGRGGGGRGEKEERRRSEKKNGDKIYCSSHNSTTPMPATLCDFVLVEVGALSVSTTAVESSKVDEVGGTVW